MARADHSRWLLTRAADDAAEDVAALRAHGVAAVSLPCVEFSALPWPTWPAHPGTPLFVLTSRRAAQALLESGEDLSQVRLAATAPATAALLQRARLPVLVTAAGGAEGLARAVVARWEAAGRPAWHCHYPTSDAGAHAAEQAAALALLERVGPVERRAVYRTQPTPNLAQALGRHTQGAWCPTFHSPSAVSAFVAAVPHGARAPEHVVCFGASTARAWDGARQPGWPAAIDSTHVVDTILTLEHRKP